MPQLSIVGYTPLADEPKKPAGTIIVRPRAEVLGDIDRMNAADQAANAPGLTIAKYEPPRATDEERRTVVGFLGNAVKSTGSLVGGLLNVPEQVKGMTSLFAGMAEKSGYKALPGQPDVNAVDALVAHYKDRYGSLEGFKKALYEDPAGVALDVATVLEPAAAGMEAAGLPRAAAIATRAARGINPLIQTGRAAGAVVSRGLPAIDAAMEATAQGLRQSSLRGGYTVNTPNQEVAGAARAMRGMPLTTESLEQVTQQGQALQQQKMQALAEAEMRGAAVPRSQIVQGLQDLRQQYTEQPLPGRDVKQIDRAIQEVVTNYPEQIPATRAEAIKEGLTWKEGLPPELQATAGAEKTIADVIRKNLVEWAPELEELNKTQQGRIWLKDIMGDALNKRLNSPGLLNRLFNMKTMGAGLAGSFMGPQGILGGAAVAAVLSDPVIQSHLAVAINRAQELNPARWGRPNMGAAAARAGKVAEDARIPTDRRLPAPVQDTIIPPPPADGSFVRSVPAEYGAVDVIPPERRLPAPTTIITPEPPDRSFVRSVPAEYPKVIPPEQVRVETLTEYLVRNKVSSSQLDKLPDKYWDAFARQAGVDTPSAQDIQTIRANLAELEGGANPAAAVAVAPTPKPAAPAAHAKR